MARKKKDNKPSPIKKPNPVSSGFLSNLYGSTNDTETDTTSTPPLQVTAKLPFTDEEPHDDFMSPNHPQTIKKKPKPKNSTFTNLNSSIDAEAEGSSLLPKSPTNPNHNSLEDIVGFLIICSVVLVGDTARGVMFPTLWPLVKSLGGNKVHQGVAVGAFSFGRVLSSPILGKKSVDDGYKSTLTLSCSILLLGTLFYALTEKLDNLPFLIIAQLTMGVGSGTLGVTRAYVAEITPREQRTTYIALLTAVQYGGFTVMPVVGSFFCSLFKESEGLDLTKKMQLGPFILDSFTAPAYFMTALCVLCLVLLRTAFTDLARTNTNTKTKTLQKLTVSPGNEGSFVNDIDFFAEEKLCCNLSRFDSIIFFMMMLNVATKGTIGVYETLTVNFATSHFVSYDSVSAGLLVSSCGIIGCAFLLSMRFISRCMTDVQMISWGIFLMIIGTGLLVHFDNHGHFTKGRFETAIFLLYSVGYPVGHTAVIGIFSKICGNRPQGLLLGWFASAGSLARIFMPIMSGTVSEYYGNSYVFCCLVVVLAVALMAVLFTRRTLGVLSGAIS